jgi:hypothetical protein
MSSPWLERLFRFGGTADVSVPADATMSAPVQIPEAASAKRLVRLVGAPDEEFAAIIGAAQVGDDWLVLNDTNRDADVRGPVGPGMWLVPGAMRQMAFDGTRLRPTVGNLNGSEFTVDASLVLTSGLVIAQALAARISLDRGVAKSFINEQLYAAGTTTTDVMTSLTTVIGIPNGATGRVEAEFVATKGGGDAHWSNWLRCGFTKVGGIMTLGTVTPGTPDTVGTTTGMSAALVAETNNIRTRGQGRAGETWLWSVFYRVHWRTTEA